MNDPREILENLIKQRGYPTQEAAAADIGIDAGQLCRIRKRKQIPGLATALKLRAWSGGLLFVEAWAELAAAERGPRGFLTGEPSGGE